MDSLKTNLISMCMELGFGWNLFHFGRPTLSVYAVATGHGLTDGNAVKNLPIDLNC